MMFFSVDFVRSGKLERFLDAHPNPRLNSAVEYYWAILLDLSGRKESALYRYERVKDNYEKMNYAPMAWSNMITIYFEDNKRSVVMEECEKFIEKYPGHPKVELCKKRINFIKHGY